MASPSGESREETVRRALLDYYEAPGKHRLRLRQPAVLFASVPLVLQLAAARSDSANPRETQLRKAASFFIRAAMLYPGADHYALFGLESRKEPMDLKERYRLLMRLTHPDFAAAGEWPADAAIRANRAYEVLSSPVHRRAYDDQLASQRRAAGLPEHAGAPTRRLHRLATGTVVAVAVAGAVLILAPGPRPVSLVQKRSVPPPRTPAPADTLPRPADPPPVAPAAIAMVTPPPAPAASVPVPEKQPQPPAPAAATAVAPARVSVPAPAPAPAGARPVRTLAAAREETPTLPVAVAAPAPPPAAAVTAPSPAPPAALPVLRTSVESARPAARAAVATAALAAPHPAPAASPTLAEAQPLLSQMLETLQAGSGERLLALLDPSARQVPAALALSRQYDELVGGAATVRLAQGEFRSESRNGVLQVTSVLRVHAGEPAIGSHGQRFAVRAEFALRDGKVQLTGLSSAGD